MAELAEIDSEHTYMTFKRLFLFFFTLSVVNRGGGVYTLYILFKCLGSCRFFKEINIFLSARMY